MHTRGRKSPDGCSELSAQVKIRKALDMLDLGRPDLDFVALARNMGAGAPSRIPWTISTAPSGRGLATAGPYLSKRCWCEFVRCAPLVLT